MTGRSTTLVPQLYLSRAALEIKPAIACRSMGRSPWPTGQEPASKALGTRMAWSSKATGILLTARLAAAAPFRRDWIPRPGPPAAAVAAPACAPVPAPEESAKAGGRTPVQRRKPTMRDLIKDVTTQSFMKDVMEESRRQPVLVDFWAPWCGPCKQLTLVLEKAVRALKGKAKLVKMNIDEHPAIAGQMVRSPPPSARRSCDLPPSTAPRNNPAAAKPDPRVRSRSSIPRHMRQTGPLHRLSLRDSFQLPRPR